MRFFVAAFLTPLVLASCLSLPFGPPEVLRSREVGFSEPVAPYESVNRRIGDHSWSNPANGNTLSFVSACSDVMNSLEELRDRFASSIPQMKILDSAFVIWKNQRALKANLSGIYDGVPVFILAFFAVHENCAFTVSLVSVNSDFHQETNIFDDFINSFAPHER